MTEYVPEEWQVIHSPARPLQLPPTAGFGVGTIIRHKASGKQFKLLSDQRDGPYWAETTVGERIHHE